MIPDIVRANHLRPDDVRNHRVRRPVLRRKKGDAYTVSTLLRQNAPMSAIHYPVAPNAESALVKPLGHCARASDAQIIANGAVEFATHPAGPAFETEAEALAAFAGKVDDPEHGKVVQPENRFCTLRYLVAVGVRKRPRQAKATFKDGHRWGPVAEPPRTVWRLSVSYWRVLGAEERAVVEQARRARKRADAKSLDAAALLAMAHQPMAAFQPQQALDIGLFEFRPPEAPHIIMPDE
jgi:hypothetical protein